MNAAQQALVDRWDAFIAKIKERLQEIMTESEEGVRGLIANDPTDWYSISNALGALDYRVQQLKDRMTETWDSQVEPKFSDIGGRFLDVGLDRKRDAEMALDAAWGQWKANMAVAFYRNLEPMARADMAKPVNCTQCGAALTVPDRLSMQSVRCGACNAVNQVAPTQILTTYAAAATHYADAEVYPLRVQIERFREDVDRWRRANNWAHEGLGNLEKWYAMESDFWQKFVHAVAKYSGKAPDTSLAEARLKQWLKYGLEMDQVWVKAKGRQSG